MAYTLSGGAARATHGTQARGGGVGARKTRVPWATAARSTRVTNPEAAATGDVTQTQRRQRPGTPKCRETSMHVPADVHAGRPGVLRSCAPVGVDPHHVRRRGA